MIKNSPFANGVTRGATAADYFRIVAHYLTRYSRLSFGAKGMHVLILGLPPEEVITEEALASYSTDGVKTIRRYLGELQAHGFLVRGERFRYPAGTVNGKGKPIGGALGPYSWYATDQLDEVTNILAHRQAEVERQREETAGQSYRPNGEPGSDEGVDDPVDNSDLPPQTAGSSDQAKEGVFQDQHYRPDPPVGKGSSFLEEQLPKEEQEEPGAACGRDPGGLRPPGPETSAATAVGGTTQPGPGGDHLTARGRETGLGLQWHGAGSLALRSDVAARHELNRVHTSRPGPTWEQRKAQRQQLDPQMREAVRAELDQQRAAGPRRAPIPSPPPSSPSGGVIPPDAAPPSPQRRSGA